MYKRLLFLGMFTMISIIGNITFAQTTNCFDLSEGSWDEYMIQDTLYPQITNPTSYYSAYNQGASGISSSSACSCQDNFKKISKTVYTKGGDNAGSPTNQKINVCQKCDPELCNCGVKLNTPVPFIGRCIVYGNTTNTSEDGTTRVNAMTVFPVLMGAIVKILMGVILIASFGAIILGGVMMTIPGQYKKGKDLVIKVVRVIVALGSLGVILTLINPNFFR